MGRFTKCVAMWLFASVVTWPIVASAQDTGRLSLGEKSMQALVSAIIGAVFGAISAYIKTRLEVKKMQDAFDFKVKEMEKQLKLQHDLEREKEETQLRIKYVNPLRSATIALKERMAGIDLKIGDAMQESEMRGWFSRIKDDPAFRHSDDFPLWCNGVGTWAMNTLHIMARFFAYASPTRNEVPFRELDRKFNDRLTQALFRMRAAFNDDGHGIYEQLQDSIADQMRQEGSVKTYEQFCRSIANDKEYPSYLRLMDYCLDLHLKKQNVQKIREELNDLYHLLEEDRKLNPEQTGAV
jgi:hypothetical protein